MPVPFLANKMSLIIDGEVVDAEVLSVTFESGDKDSGQVSIADGRSGGSRDYVLKIRCYQGAKLWRHAWSNPGDELPVIWRTNPTGAVTVDNPNFTSVAVVSEPNGTFMGGEATNSASQKLVVDFEWQLKARPVMVTA